MGKYQSGVKRPEARYEGPPPIWRGIGCLLIVLVPVMSYAMAVLTLPFFREQGLVPRELMVNLQTPDWMRISPVIVQVYQALLGRPGILAELVLTFVYILAIGGVLTVVYAVMYRITAPSRYGPMDAPPARIKVKKYKR